METPKKTTPKKPKLPPTVVETPKPHNLPSITETALSEPIKEGNKLSLPKTWLSEKQSMKIMQRTPAQYIYERPGKGGKNFKYVPVKYVEKCLNFIFGWNWDFQIVSKEVHGLAEGWGQIITHGRLTVKGENGQTIIKEQFGQAEVKYLKQPENDKSPRKPVSLGNDFKASASDALKKCASELGIASDVYGANEYREIKVEAETDQDETLFNKIKSMIGKANNPNALKALNISITNAKISDEEKQTLYDLIEAKANGTTTA